MTDNWVWQALENASQEDLQSLADLLIEKGALPHRELGARVEGDLRLRVHDALLCAGGHSIANLFRGRGPHYADIVRAAATKLKIQYSPVESTPEVEERVAIAVLRQFPEGVTEEQLAELGSNLARIQWHKDLPLWKGLLTLMLATGRLVGLGFQQLTVRLTELLMGTFSLVGLDGPICHTLGSLVGFLAGPFGWILLGLWTLLDIQGPAFRATIPSIAVLSTIRAKASGHRRRIGFGD